MTTLHRAIRFPRPDRRPPNYDSLRTLSTGPGGWEISRTRDGHVSYVIVSQTPGESARLEATLQRVFPSMRFQPAECPVLELARRFSGSSIPQLLLRGRLSEASESTMLFDPATDHGDLLLRLLRTLPPVDVRIQVLHEPEVTRHVEVRALAIGAPHALEEVGQVLPSWLDQFSQSHRSGTAFYLETVQDRLIGLGCRTASFTSAMLDHNVRAFRGHWARRNLPWTALGPLLSIPWQSHHSELTYVDAPDLSPPPSRRVATDGLVVGTHGGRELIVPEPWHHLGIVGMTRTGKSTVLHHLALQVLLKRPNARVVVLDPHGTLVSSLKMCLPPPVSKFTVELDPSSNSFEEEGTRKVAIPLNPLHIPPGPPGARAASAQLAVGDLLQTFRNVWGEDMVGARVEHFLGLTLKGLLEVDGMNLVDAYRVLTERDSRAQLAEWVSDPTVKSFLTQDLPAYQSGPKRDVLLSTLNKLGRVVSNPLLRETLCQRSGVVSIKDLLANRLVLVNLSKGRLGTDTSRFLGSVFLTQLWMALLRGGSPDRPVYLFVDEFQNFASESFATILSESAKYGLHLVLANQYLGQVPRETLAAVRGNVDSWAFFRLDPRDAEIAHQIAQADRVGLEPTHTSLLEDHQGLWVGQGQVFSFTTRPIRPVPPPPEAMEGIRRNSRRFATEETSLRSPLDGHGVDMVPFLERAASGMPVTASPDSLAPRRALSKGYAERLEPTGAFRVTPLGGAYLAACKARGSAKGLGEEHSDLLARFVVYLQTHGVSARIVEQRQLGIPQADGEFEWDGVRYTVEVESTTLAGDPEQVLKNIDKACSDGRIPLEVVMDEPGAVVVHQLVRTKRPPIAPGRDFLIMFPRDGGFVRYPDGDPEPFVRTAPPPAPVGTASGCTSNPVPPAPNLGDLERLREASQELRSEGGELVTMQEVLERLAPGAMDRFSPEAFGRHMTALGVPVRRIWMGGRRTRVYDLSNWSGPSGPATRPEPVRPPVHGSSADPAIGDEEPVRGPDQYQSRGPEHLRDSPSRDPDQSDPSPPS